MRVCVCVFVFEGGGLFVDVVLVLVFGFLWGILHPSVLKKIANLFWEDTELNYTSFVSCTSHEIILMYWQQGVFT